jgi:hypothetical protein
MAASCLTTLGGPSHDDAYGMLAAMADQSDLSWTGLDTRLCSARPFASSRSQAQRWLEWGTGSHAASDSSLSRPSDAATD